MLGFLGTKNSTIGLFYTNYELIEKYEEKQKPEKKSQNKTVIFYDVDAKIFYE